jgi:hypothetical protein
MRQANVGSGLDRPSISGTGDDRSALELADVNVSGGCPGLQTRWLAP